MAWIYFSFIFESLTNYCDVVRCFSSWFWLLFILSSLFIFECCWHVDLDMGDSFLFYLCLFLIWNLFFLVLVWLRLFFFKSSVFRIPLDTVALLGWWTWIVFLWSCLGISLFPSSILKYSFIGYSSLGLQLHTFKVWNILFHAFQGFRVSVERSHCILAFTFANELVFSVTTFNILCLYFWHMNYNVARPCLFVLG